MADEHHSVMIGEKVVLSLRTKAPETAKTRFRLAAQALGNYFDAIAKGPQPLTRTQRTALVGDIYREAVRDLETDDSFLDAIEATTAEFDARPACRRDRRDCLRCSQACRSRLDRSRGRWRTDEDPGTRYHGGWAAAGARRLRRYQKASASCAVLRRSFQRGVGRAIFRGHGSSGRALCVPWRTGCARQVVARLHPLGGSSSEPQQVSAPMEGYVLRQTEHAFAAKGQLLGNVGTPL